MKTLTDLEILIQKHGGKKLMIELASLAFGRQIKEGTYGVYIDEDYKEYSWEKPVNQLRVEFNINTDYKSDDIIGDYSFRLDEYGNASIRTGVEQPVKNQVKIFEILLPIFSQKFKREEVIKEVLS